MVETLISAALLTPIFLGVWYIASLQNLSLSGLAGARYGFISLYVADRESALPDLRAIVTFDDPLSPLSYDASFAISDETPIPLIDDVQSVTTSLLAPVQALSSRRFDVSDAVSRRLNARLSIDPAGWSGLGSLVPTLTIDAPAAVLVGVAASAGRVETLDRVQALSASIPFETLTRPLSVLRPALEVLEPSFSRFCPGRLEPDIVPVDRLSSAGVIDNDMRVRPCN